MLEISIKKKEDSWIDVSCPVALSERIALLKSLCGQKVIIELKTSEGRTYLCGTESLAEMMHKQNPDFNYMSCESAWNEIEYNTEFFCNVIQIFSKKKDIEKVFPEPPEIKGAPKKEKKSITKTDIDRYLVKIGEKEHLVDLSEFGGNGWCACEDFTFRKLPEIEKEMVELGKLLTPRRCKHIIYAIEQSQQTLI